MPSPEEIERQLRATIAAGGMVERTEHFRTTFLTPLTKVQFKKLRQGAVVPARATSGSSGYDLSIPNDDISTLVIRPAEILKPSGELHDDSKGFTLFPDGLVIICTGIAINIQDPEWEAQIRARSGLSTKRRLIIVNGIGTVDSDYHGELMVALLNLSGESQQLRCGERIAQLVFCPISCPTLEEVTDFEQPTERNTGGFGSTGS